MHCMFDYSCEASPAIPRSLPVSHIDCISLSHSLSHTPLNRLMVLCEVCAKMACEDVSQMCRNDVRFTDEQAIINRKHVLDGLNPDLDNGAPWSKH